MGEIVKEMKGFRNILVHRYGEINNAEAFENISSGLNDFESFMKEVNDFVVSFKRKLRKR